LRKLLEKLSKEKLIDFLVEYAANDANFVNEVNIRFRKPEFEAELAKIENKIDLALGRRAALCRRALPGETTLWHFALAVQTIFCI